MVIFGQASSSILSWASTDIFSSNSIKKKLLCMKWQCYLFYFLFHNSKEKSFDFWFTDVVICSLFQASYVIPLSTMFSVNVINEFSMLFFQIVCYLSISYGSFSKLWCKVTLVIEKIYFYLFSVYKNSVLLYLSIEVCSCLNDC